MRPCENVCIPSSPVSVCGCVCPCLNIIIKGTKCWYFWILRQRFKKWFGVMVGVRGLGTALCQYDALTKMWKQVCVWVCMTQRERELSLCQNQQWFLTLWSPYLLITHSCCEPLCKLTRVCAVMFLGVRNSWVSINHVNYSCSCTYDTQLWEQNTSCNRAF